MVEITSGFKLFQPWATDVVRGRLKYLVRSFPTKRRERVAVIATKGIDGIWLENASEKEIKDIENKIGAIGSVEIKDCIEVDGDKVEEELIRLAGKEYWDYYPKHLVPRNAKTGKSYIWVLEGAREWSEAKPVKGGGIIWAKVNLKDE